MRHDSPALKSVISVIVPARQAVSVLPACLDAIGASTRAPDEVIVVVDGPCGDGTAEVASRHGVRVLPLPQRHGPGGARNAGVAAARGEIVVFVDADVAVNPDAIERLAAALEEDPSLEAVFGSYDDHPPEENLASQYKNLLHHYVHQRGREDASTFWAGLGAVRRSVFDASGGFDESRYPRPSIEDIEWGVRLTRGRGHIRLLKSARATHLKRWTAAKVFRTDVLDRAAPWTELILGTRALPDDLNLGLRHRVGVAATAVAGLALLPGDVRLLPVSALALGVAVASGSDVLAFFARRRGVLFALRAIPMHLLYYAASGLGFLLGLGRHLTRRAG